MQVGLQLLKFKKAECTAHNFENVVYHIHLPNTEFSWLQNRSFAKQDECIVLEVVYTTLQKLGQAV